MLIPPYQTATNLNNSAIAHGFFGSEGGFSTGLYQSLNCGLNKGDDDSKVMQNRQLICDTMGIQTMITIRQVHKNNVLIVNSDTKNGQEYDAMVTQTPKLLLAIKTADCAPILLHDPVHKVIGAIHAGWRSAVSGIVANTIKAMESIGANRNNITASIGPCIQQQNFEVGQEVFDSAFDVTFFTKANRTAHYLYDLSGFLLNQLKKEDVKSITITDLDTYSLEKKYFSCRRALHKKESAFGNQLSVIGLV